MSYAKFLLIEAGILLLTLSALLRLENWVSTRGSLLVGLAGLTALLAARRMR